MNPSIISLILPIVSATRDIVMLFQKDYSRAPTDEELVQLFNDRQSANESWEAVLRRLRENN